jgi:hypothetical protein
MEDIIRRVEKVMANSRAAAMRADERSTLRFLAAMGVQTSNETITIEQALKIVDAMVTARPGRAS